MIQTKFIEGVGGKLAERWVATLLTPAFCFWAGGVGAWLYRFGWSSLKERLIQLSEANQIALIAGTLLIVAASGFAIQRFDLSILRLLEGYWPRWIKPLHWWRRGQIRRQIQHLSSIKEGLRALMQQNLTIEKIEEKALLEYQKRWLPSQPQYLMPTSLGNILRATERRPSEKYGLEAVVCWPRLWFLLPEHVRSDVQEARANLNTAARVWLWGILFSIVWTIFAWWALPIGLATAWFAYRWSLEAARNYGELVDAAFDLYRQKLYEALRLPCPIDSEDEQAKGSLLTEYLWRGPVRLITYQKAEQQNDDA